ncbi:MAG: hypothetical protein K2K96_01745 [Lachnospiraceae bacterium]|nr:hypothetical protein [Lachnospiraceae bacterium]
MPLEACLQAAYDFMSEHRAKPASEMEQSGIELSTADLWYNMLKKSGKVTTAYVFQNPELSPAATFLQYHHTHAYGLNPWLSFLP